MVSFMWKELGSQDFKTVGLHQPLNYITRINTQVGSYVLWNVDWPYLFCTNKPIGTMFAHNEFPTLKFALKRGPALSILYNNI